MLSTSWVKSKRRPNQKPERKHRLLLLEESRLDVMEGEHLSAEGGVTSLLRKVTPRRSPLMCVSAATFGPACRIRGAAGAIAVADLTGAAGHSRVTAERTRDIRTRSRTARQSSSPTCWKQGQEIIEQIAKEPLWQERARASRSHVALPGVTWFICLRSITPECPRKIASAEERSRLRHLVNDAKGRRAAGSSCARPRPAPRRKTSERTSNS